MEPRLITTKKFTVFMLIAFGVAYIPLIAAGLFLNQGKMIPTMILFRVIAIFIPLIGVLVSGLSFKQLGFKIKNRFKYIIMALMGPQILSWIGTAIFFIFFHDNFEIGFGSFLAQMPAEVNSSFDSLPIDPKMIFGILAFQSLTILPISQIIPSLGEEAGWRGVMYPYLKNKFGKTVGRLIGGALWGIWHWPLVILGGQFYGKDYLGAPILGPLMICIALAAFGIFIDYLYEKTGSILIASVAHSAMNCAAIPMLLISISNQNVSIFGPTNFALIPVIPVIIVGIFILLKDNKINE